MKRNKDVKEVLITSAEIKRRVKQMAQEISADFAGEKPLVVGVLKGAWAFMADLVREIDCDCEVDFVTVSSYGNGTVSSGSIKILKDLTTSCEGKDVLIVEDIIDTGITLSRLRDLFYERKAKSVSIATFLSKPARRKVNVPVNYVGFEILDKFVIGYGMDYAENYRGLKDVCVLKEEIYKR